MVVKASQHGQAAAAAVLATTMIAGVRIRGGEVADLSLRGAQSGYAPAA